METVTGEVLNINNEYKSYQEYKAAVDTELQKSAESFVRIGYLLKVARDTDILKESMYSSVNEFAQAEYNLDKSQVSRFIRINDEYSEGGYSDHLQDKYREYGYAKLSLMLLLPAAVNEELSANYSKSEIQAIKEELDEESKTTDLEILMEDKNEDQKEMDIFTKVLHQIGYDQPELYLKLHEIVNNMSFDGSYEPIVKKVIEVLAPSGEHIYSARIPGEGRKMLSIKGADKDPVVIDIRSGEAQVCKWSIFLVDIKSLSESEDGKKSWEKLYGESYPEEKKEEVAPVQPKKQSKVTKAKVEKTKPVKAVKEEKERMNEDGKTGSERGQAESRNEDEQEAADGCECSAESDGAGKEPGSDTDAGEEQLPGQMQLEKDFPEYCPEKKEEVAPVQHYTGEHGQVGVYVTCLKEMVIPETGEIVYIGPAAERLSAYEKTGLTPEQICEIDVLYAEKCREVADLTEKIKDLQEAAGVEKTDGEA